MLQRTNKTTFKMNFKTIAVVAVAFVGIALSACKRDEKFPDLGMNVASPVDLALSEDQKYFYALNADFDRRYNTGSILVLTPEGEKVGVAEVPRVGRSIAVSGTDLLVTTASGDDKSSPGVFLYSLSDPKKPTLVRQWVPECVPLNAVMRKGYKYFAISCVSGQLLIGTLADQRENSTLKLVRDYGTARRAMHLDPERNLLFLFATDLGEQVWSDLELEDSKSYDELNNITEASNEVPDSYESSRRSRANKSVRQKFQFIVYDIGAESKASPEPFPLRAERDAVFDGEARWMHFNLTNFDGTPDTDTGFTADGMRFKYYRTNFWKALPDRNDPDLFYLSHRGHSESNRERSKHANSIVRVRITASPIGADGGAHPKTADFLSFERIYGFKGEINENGLQYPGDFSISQNQGQQLLVVNHFRDLFNWPRKQVYFSIAAKVIDDNFWFDEFASTSGFDSFFSLAVTDQGRGMACSFYGSSLIMFDVAPGTAIKEINRIK